MVEANSIMMHGFENSGQSSSATPTEQITAALRLQTLSQSIFSDSITTRTYSAASSRTDDTDYGIQYTRRALSPVPYDSDYRQDRNQNSNSYSNPAHGEVNSYFAEYEERMPMDEVTEELVINIQKPPPSLTPEYLKSHFLQEGRLTDGQALHIINTATDVFSRESNMVHIQSPVTICGDIRGQYLDLMKLFEVGSSLQDNFYLFLGDYANGNDQGVECLLYLYSLKIHNSGQIVLLRGCHECRHPSEIFTFKRECLQKYTETVYEAFLRSFRSLPITALVDEKLFCVHGGISPGLNTLNDINQINRFVEIGSYGLLCDLLCSDPFPYFDEQTEPIASRVGLASRVASRATFIYSSMGDGRPSGSYTYEGVCHFLDLNSLLMIINGHSARTPTGYRMYRRTKKNNPSVITISSRSNYLNTPRIRGVVLIYAKEILIKQFVSYPGTNGARGVLGARRGVIQSKIRVIGRFLFVLRLLRMEADIAMLLGGEPAAVVSRPLVIDTLRASDRSRSNRPFGSNIPTFPIEPRSVLFQPQQPSVSLLPGPGIKPYLRTKQ